MDHNVIPKNGEAAPLARVRHTFKVPKSLAAKHQVYSVTLIELNAEEELRASKRTQMDPLRITFELAKQSLVAIDKTQVYEADGSADRAWQMMHPQIRQLVVRAYQSVHNPVDTDVQDFLASRETSVG